MTKTAIMPRKADVMEDIEPAAEYADALLAAMPTFAITSKKKFDKASTVLLEVKRMAKELEAQRTSVTKPMLAAKRTVDSWFTPQVKKLERVEDFLKDAISGYLKQTHADREQAPAETEELQMPTGLQARRKTLVKLIDIEAVPEAYLKPKQVDWAKVADAHKRGETVPGIEAEVDYSIAVVG